MGFNVSLQRTIAFTLAGTVAGFAGVMNIWWNGQIDPTSISIGPTLDLLIVAVIGGIAHLEGAWLGAFVFVIANNYMRDLPFASSIGLTKGAFQHRRRAARAVDHDPVARRSGRRDHSSSQRSRPLVRAAVSNTPQRGEHNMRIQEGSTT